MEEIISESLGSQISKHRNVDLGTEAMAVNTMMPGT